MSLHHLRGPVDIDVNFETVLLSPADLCTPKHCTACQKEAGASGSAPVQMTYRFDQIWVRPVGYGSTPRTQDSGQYLGLMAEAAKPVPDAFLFMAQYPIGIRT